LNTESGGFEHPKRKTLNRNGGLEDHAGTLAREVVELNSRIEITEARQSCADDVEKTKEILRLQ
jgi:hypothetical protein